MTYLLLTKTHTCVSPATMILMKSCPTRTTINVSWLSILIYVHFPLTLQQWPDHSQEENQRLDGIQEQSFLKQAHAPDVSTTDHEEIGLTRVR